MLKQIGRSKLALFSLIFIAIVSFGTLLVSRFNATAIRPTANTVQSSPEESQTELMQPTDKTEMAQTELMQPSEAVVNAEHAMPAPNAPAYYNACQRMKQVYSNDYHSKLQAENSRHQAATQAIINRYNREGRSFSSMEKSAQARENERHEQYVQYINNQYQRQLKGLNC